MRRWLKTFVWIVTGSVALLLLVLTVQFAMDQAATEDVQLSARVMGNAMFVQLHEEPHVTASISTMVERYTYVTVIDAHYDGQTEWFLIEWEGEQGWTVSANLGLMDP